MNKPKRAQTAEMVESAQKILLKTYVIWFIAAYFYILAPKIITPMVGSINYGVIGVLMILLLSRNIRLFSAPGALLCVALIFLFLHSVMHLTAFSSGGFRSYGYRYYFSVVPLYVITGMLAGFSWKPKTTFNYFCEIFLKIFFAVGVVNSVIILAAFFSAEFRNLTEALLYQEMNTNIDYDMRDNRLRGIAAGGGANLSLYLGALVVVGSGLYLYKRLTLLSTAASCLTILLSMMVVGRTGFVAAVFGLGMLMSISIAKSSSFHRVQKRSFYFLSLTVFSALALPAIGAFLLGAEVYRYALGFIYGGISGFRDEGTVSVIAHFYHVPESIPALLFGIGNGSGSFSYGASTDAGYMKMFTAVGITGSLVFYGSILYFLRKLSIISGMTSLFLTLMFIWFLAEFKEPFMVKGYLSRMMWFFIGATLAFSHRNRLRSGNTDKTRIIESRQ